MNITFNPQPKQSEAWIKLSDNSTRYIVYGGAAGGGKTFLGCSWLIIMAIAYPGTRYFIGREELKRLKQSVMPSMDEARVALGMKEKPWVFNAQESYYLFSNGSRIDLLDLRFLPSDPLYERYGSLLYTSGWIEEAGEVNFNAYDTLKSRINRWMNAKYGIFAKILITCNPKKNWLYTYFWKPWKHKTLAVESFFIPALYTDNKYTSEDYGETLATIRDISKRERLMKGNWEYADDPSSLLDYDKIIDMFSHNASKETDEKYLTCDVARFGRDKSYVVVWKGWHITNIYSFDRNSTTQLSSFIKNITNKENIPMSNVIIDSDGVGGGVVDELSGCKAFLNGTTPIVQKRDEYKKRQHIYEENYANLKSQCVFYTASKILAHEVSVTEEIAETDKQNMIEELEQWKRKDFENDEKKVGVVAKEDIKENIGRSPDLSDCLYMRALGDLTVKSFGAVALNPAEYGKGFL